MKSEERKAYFICRESELHQKGNMQKKSKSNGGGMVAVDGALASVSENIVLCVFSNIHISFPTHVSKDILQSWLSFDTVSCVSSYHSLI